MHLWEKQIQVENDFETKLEEVERSWSSNEAAIRREKKQRLEELEDEFLAREKANEKAKRLQVQSLKTEKAQRLNQLKAEFANGLAPKHEKDNDEVGRAAVLPSLPSSHSHPEDSALPASPTASHLSQSAAQSTPQHDLHAHASSAVEMPATGEGSHGASPGILAPGRSSPAVGPGIVHSEEANPAGSPTSGSGEEAGPRPEQVDAQQGPPAAEALAKEDTFFFVRLRKKSAPSSAAGTLFISLIFSPLLPWFQPFQTLA